MPTADRLIADLRRMGFSEAQIAGGVVEGKPLAEAMVDKPKAADPYKSKMERLFAWELQEQLKAGEIDWWAFESITLVIVDVDGKRCRYTPDFVVSQRQAGPFLIFYEVKGFLREAARIRFLAARERYPFWKFIMIRHEAGHWEEIL